MFVVDGDDGIDLDALGLHIHKNEGDALLLLALVAGSHQNENPVGVLGITGPDLGAIDHVVVAIQFRLGFQGSQVGARTRLGVALAPPGCALEDAREEFILLLLGTELVDHGPYHANTEGNDPGDAPLRTLGFVDILLGRRPAGTAVLHRPVGRYPALLVKALLPFTNRLLEVVRPQPGDQLIIELFIKECPYLFSERQFIG